MTPIRVCSIKNSVTPIEMYFLGQTAKYHPDGSHRVFERCSIGQRSRTAFCFCCNLMGSSEIEQLRKKITDLEAENEALNKENLKRNTSIFRKSSVVSFHKE